MAEAKKTPLRDHSEGLNPDLIVNHAKTLKAYRDELKGASSQLRNERKRMKENGVDLAAYDLAVSLMALDPNEAKLRLNRAFFILNALHAPVGSQLTFQDMLDNNAPVSDAEREKRWGEEGAHAYVTGQAETSMPHAPNTPAGRAWLTGYRGAESAALAVASEKEKAAPDPFPPTGAEPPAGQEPPAKRGRGRPPGSGKKPKLTLVTDNADAPPPEPVEPPAPDEPPVPESFDADSAGEEFSPPPPEPSATDAPPVPEFEAPPEPPAV